MRILIQRVRRASVTVNGKITGQIGPGLLALVGLGAGDSASKFPKAIDKLTNLRIFQDENGAMNRSVRDIGGGLLLVSQFTLYADARKGRRPSFTNAMPPTEAEALFAEFVEAVRKEFDGPVETGVFGASMAVELLNEGPVTIWLDSEELGW